MEINVLSLFDGISCGAVALERAGFEIKNYYAYEIERNAIKISEKNYPDIQHLGDVTKEDFTKYKGKIDILIGGSPCQNLCSAGDRTGLEGIESRLFYDYVRALYEAEPKWFLLENNATMTKENQDIITEIMGVEPVYINSNLLSAQDRKRLYWTNIKGVEPPKDKGILLKDIVHEHTDAPKDPELTKRLESYKVPIDKSLRIIEKEVQKGKIGYFRTDSQAHRVYSIHGKAVTLLGEAGGGAAKMGQYLFGCITPDREKKRQNWQRFNTGDKFYTLTAQDQHGILIDGYIRKLTPTECERLQTLPDGYTKATFEGKQISDTQRYKMLGNGWTTDIIAHILSYIHEERA